MSADLLPRRRRRPMAEINVVPYIDVMLVLLIIFMVTAPLLNLGVQVELPQASAEPLADLQEPLRVVIDRDGNLALDAGDGPELVDDTTLVERLRVLVERNEKLSVLIEGDRSASYERVYQALTLLQQAGVASVGFMGDLPEPPSGR